MLQTTHSPGLSAPVRMALFYGAYFMVFGIMTPFWPVWLADRGLSADEIGLVFAVSSVTRVLLSPNVAALSDRRGERKRPMVLLCLLALIASVAYFPLYGFWPIFILAGLTSFLFSAINPLSEVLAVRISRANNADYGRMRLWGSITFIVASLSGGALLSWPGQPFGSDAILIWMILFTMVTLVTILVLPDIRSETDGTDDTGLLARFAVLLRDWRLVLFMASAASVQAAHAVYYVFGTINWQRLGYDEALIGLLWSIGVIAEIILFSFSGWVVARLGPYRLLMIASACAVVRWAVMAFDPPLVIVFLSQLLHAGTFGAAHLAAIHFVARYVPDKNAVTAQSLYTSLFMGIIMGAAAYGAGILYGAFESTAFLVMSGIGAVALVLSFVLRLTKSEALA